MMEVDDKFLGNSMKSNIKLRKFYPWLINVVTDIYLI